MSWLEIMPTVNASLNGLSGALVVAGFHFVRQKNIERHKKLMLSACVSSTLFLVCYLVYHAFAGTTRFSGTGWIRPVYFFILITHTFLATAVLPMVIVTVWRGLTDKIEKHRRVARWTLPVWIYVSVTGVLVYVFLYHLYPSA